MAGEESQGMLFDLGYEDGVTDYSTILQISMQLAVF